ncbi:MAG TPA: class I SAM-dependent methyltransferase [Thermoleophilia bacterium]|nr:class I SAM-dependent methyltransferase [Thermoleophilia bacterium]
MDDRTADETAALAALYDAVHAGRDDAAFWRAMAAAAVNGVILELGCGTGRVLLALARAGYEVTGLDLASHMLDRCRAKLAAEPAEVRERVRVLAADMTAFDVGRRFALITVPFAGFQHLRTVEQQLACLERCRDHLLPGGRLVLDLPNPDPTPPSHVHDEGPTDGEATAQLVDWTEGRRIRWWATVVDYQRALQCAEYEVTYEIIAADGATSRISETFPLRYVFRYELEHLLVRSGFLIGALYGDYDRSPFADGSPAMIVVAQPSGG